MDRESGRSGVAHLGAEEQQAGQAVTNEEEEGSVYPHGDRTHPALFSADH